MRNSHPLLLTLLLAVPASAQTIHGVVVEYGTKSVVAGATVQVISPDGAAVSTTSDSLGLFRVYPRVPGRVSVRVTHPSYLMDRADTVTVHGKETVNIIVHMTRQAIAIAPIVVAARSSSILGGFHERERHNPYGRFIDEQEIERKQPVSVEHLLRSVHGVTIANEYGGVTLMLRGKGMESCPAAIYVDGMPMAVAGYDIEHLVPIGRLAAVEVYEDAIALPFEFLSIGNECGAIAFWTYPGGAYRGEDKRAGGVLTRHRLVIGALAAVAVLVVDVLLLRSGRKADISDRSLRDQSRLRRGVPCSVGSFCPRPRATVPLA